MDAAADKDDNNDDDEDDHDDDDEKVFFVINYREGNRQSDFFFNVDCVNRLTKGKERIFF